MNPINIYKVISIKRSLRKGIYKNLNFFIVPYFRYLGYFVRYEHKTTENFREQISLFKNQVISIECNNYFQSYQPSKIITKNFMQNSQILHCKILSDISGIWSAILISDFYINRQVIHFHGKVISLKFYCYIQSYGNWKLSTQKYIKPSKFAHLFHFGNISDF